MSARDIFESWVDLLSFVKTNLLPIYWLQNSNSWIFNIFLQSQRLTEADHAYNELGILAMATINEIIYRHCVPVDFEEFLLQMFQNTFELLQLLVNPPDGNEGSPPRLHSLNEQ